MMTDQSQAGGAESGSQSVILDAVAGYFRRRAEHAETEALMLAVAVRQLDQELRAARIEIATLKQGAGDHG
ncbi:hypothetical protein [Tianweitania sediminis]|uniref:Uncharacterized protein n=1 Tax=Tianweitania sediminis TaxID=1502156 RepID=A0A8J7UK84_9HYPH|nr:hypothetical protein [Tianweitania sediminis]MBP0439424.1 hypothetical protein [Tianweitania sediminis]